MLNWLRDGWCLLPRSSEERRELMQEIRYYGLSGFEGWLRTQELLGETGGATAQEYIGHESPRPRTQYLGVYPPSPHASAALAYASLASPAASVPPAAASMSPHATAMAAAGALAVTGHGGTSSWGPAGLTGATNPAFAAQHTQTFGRATSARSPAGAIHGAGGSAGSYLTETWGGGSGTGVPGTAAGVVTSLREAFMAATGPQRPAPHVAPYSLHSKADEAPSWTSKYLRGNEGLRELVNTLLELAFAAPHRALNGGKSHLSVNVACTHGRESSLVGNKDDQMRTKLLELRVRGAMGWTFELTLRPSSDLALWDKYGSIAAAVQDNWFVLGAILKDQFGVVMEEDAGSRPACAACRRTCLAVTLNKIY